MMGQMDAARAISPDTKQAVEAAVAACDSLRRAAKAVRIHHAVLADILNDRHRHVSRRSESRVRVALGLPPLPAPVSVDPCPDCGSVHHVRCRGNAGPVVVLAATDRVVKVAPPKRRRKSGGPSAEQRVRRRALGAKWNDVIEAGLSALEDRDGRNR